MTRTEHLEWAKERALEYCEAGNINDAFISFTSDMNKHDETRDHIYIPLFRTKFLGGMIHDTFSMRREIEGFN
jgi:hypothetical protein